MGDIDLSHFCYTEDDRHNLKRPWSRGDFSYATNGHIMVRVPRRQDLAVNDAAPDVEGRILSKLSFDDLRPITIPRLPPLRFFMIESEVPLAPPFNALNSECARFAGGSSISATSTFSAGCLSWRLDQQRMYFLRLRSASLAAGSAA